VKSKIATPTDAISRPNLRRGSTVKRCVVTGATDQLRTRPSAICKLTTLNLVKTSVGCDSQDTVSVTPFDSHLLCAATGVQTLFIIIRVHHIA